MDNLENTYYSTISEVPRNVLRRISTGIDAIDWIYDCTIGPDDGIGVWGLPAGKISIWYGAKGIGKSRVSIALAKSLNQLGYRVLYILCEAPLADFAQWGANVAHPEFFYVSNAETVSQIVSVMEDTRPQVVFIDSVNEIDEFCNGSKQEARRLMKGDKDHRGLKDIVNELGCHVIMLNQLNSDGTPKGGTSLPHLIDIEVKIRRATPNDKSIFSVAISDKNRHGRTGDEFFNFWRHYDWGVAPITDHQLDDEKWCQTHGLSVRYSRKNVDCSTENGDSTERKSNFMEFLRNHF